MSYVEVKNTVQQAGFVCLFVYPAWCTTGWWLSPGVTGITLCYCVVVTLLGSFATACAFLKERPHPLRLSLSLRGGNSIWLLKCCGLSMSALQPLNDHPVRSDWSTLWRGRVRNLSALPDLSVEDLACLAGSYPIWNSRRIVEADTKNPANQLLSLRVTVWLLLLFVFFRTYQLICF